MDKVSALVIKTWLRRGVLLGAWALAGCASTNHPLSDYVFSLTAWTGRDGGVDFLLLNVTDYPVRAVNVLPGALRVEVRDDAGNPLTKGYVPLFEVAELGTTDALFRSRAHRLPSQKALKGSISAKVLADLLSTRTPFDQTRIYRLGFEVDAPVFDQRNQLLLAHVRTRSLCDLSFRDGRARMDCRSPY